MQDRFYLRYVYNNKIYDVFAVDFFNKTAQLVNLDRAETLFTKVDTDKLIQCTGLRAKNGKLIYEGDIVAHINSGCVAIIEYLSSSYSLMAHIGRMDDFVPIEEICYTEAEGTPFEVIGNIYENPELLEENNVNIQP